MTNPRNPEHTEIELLAKAVFESIISVHVSLTADKDFLLSLTNRYKFKLALPGYINLLDEGEAIFINESNTFIQSRRYIGLACRDLRKHGFKINFYSISKILADSRVEDTFRLLS